MIRILGDENICFVDFDLKAAHATTTKKELPVTSNNQTWIARVERCKVLDVPQYINDLVFRSTIALHSSICASFYFLGECKQCCTTLAHCLDVVTFVTEWFIRVTHPSSRLCLVTVLGQPVPRYLYDTWLPNVPYTPVSPMSGRIAHWLATCLSIHTLFTYVDSSVCRLSSSLSC